MSELREAVRAWSEPPTDRRIHDSHPHRPHSRRQVRPDRQRRAPGPRLSFAARGILAYVLSLPPDHHLTAEWLEGQSPTTGATFAPR